MNTLFLFLGLVIGGLIVWFFLKNYGKTEVALAIQRANQLEKEIQELKLSLEERTKDLIEVSNTLSSKDTELRGVEQRLIEQKEELSELRTKLNIEFKNLANEILEEKTKKFTEQNKNNLDVILKPLNEKLKAFEKKVEETYDKEAQQRFSLKEEVKRLADLNQQISKEANSLTKALKGDSKTQGNWGEVILENILERSGLRKGHEYTVQESVTMPDGKRFQPDIIVHYPGERSIVIDSKVSLTAYERYANANSEDSKLLELKAHITSIKNHINELSGKNYEELKVVKSLDFVVMFMPIEPAYMIAIQYDNQLWTYAYNKRILLISPTNLIAVLKMIESLWKQERQNKNVMEIAQQGGSLYDDFVMFIDRLTKLGKKMDEASGFYRETMKKLSEGKGNLISRVEKLKKLGVKAKKALPDNLLDSAMEETALDS